MVNISRLRRTAAFLIAVGVLLAAMPSAARAKATPSPTASGTHKPITVTKQAGSTSPALYSSVSPAPVPSSTHKGITVTKQSGSTSPELLNAHYSGSSPEPKPSAITK